MRLLRNRWKGYAVLLAAFATFFLSTRLSLKSPRESVLEEMHVALPPIAQLIMWGGDQYAAAHFSAVRALVTPTDGLTPDQFRIMGLVQRQAARFNPYHEDNYFTGAAILPWFGEAKAASEIVGRAANARSFDPYPSYQYAFILYYFFKDSISAADWLRKAAQSTTVEEESIMFTQMAAAWLQRASDSSAAGQMLRRMAAQSRYPQLRAALLKRADRMDVLAQLRAAVEKYVEIKGALPSALDDLVASGVIAQVPADPLGRGFVLTPEGGVAVAESLKRRKP